MKPNNRFRKRLVSNDRKYNKHTWVLNENFDKNCRQLRRAYL